MPRPITPVPRSHNPFAQDDLVRDANGALTYPGAPATLIDALHAHVAARPEAEAVVELGGERLTYAELWRRAARVSGGLRALGVTRGDRVAVRCAAGTDWALAFWGTVMAGAVAVAVNTRSAPPEVEFVLADAGVKLDLPSGGTLPDGDPYVATGLDASDVATLFYTSGTTGRPKGVPTTHEAFVTNAENVIRSFGLPRDAGPDLRTLISVPLFHVTGCNAQFVVAACLGGTSVIMPALDLARLTTALTEERISFLVTVPAVYSLLLRHPAFAGADVSGVRWLAYGGAPIAPPLVRALKDAFPAAAVLNGYGMTETASLITVLPDQDSADHADSVGYAVPSVDLGVAPTGDDPYTGELVVRGVTVTSGYWRRPEATAEAMVDGWLRTGDIVRVDDSGRVHLVDRLKDVINRGGENISSVEVEAVLLSAPGVADAAVLAVPDDVMGEKVGAVLVADGPGIDVAEVIAHCRDQLADFKVPQYATVVTRALPRNAGGKLLKGRLREQVCWGDPLR
ncbi:AMP-binding protein [Kitasatospora sp. NPDC001539]|uniref:class I adenylate-forming enzyme family protein n=1 Tax=Kitasatospora sp. NPDC001539 TaxID=3154384 RepID=UPI003327B66A